MDKNTSKKLLFLRKKIDLLDNKICKLVEKRLEIAIKTIAYKKKKRDIKREKEILSRIKKNLKNKSFYPQLNSIYTEIFKQSLLTQEKYVDKVQKKRFQK